MASPTLPLQTGTPAPLGVNTYSPVDLTALINLMGAVLLELRTTNLILMEGFTLDNPGPPDYQYGMTVNEMGLFNG